MLLRRLLTEPRWHFGITALVTLFIVPMLRNVIGKIAR
jgi:hypothetical protein